MNAGMDHRFADALRQELVQLVRSSGRRRSRRSWRIGGAALGVVAVGMGATAVATSDDPLPGMDRVQVLRAGEETRRTGSSTVDFGAAPDGATHIEITFQCLSSATYTFSYGASAACREADLVRPSTMSDSIPVGPGENSLTISTDPDARWVLTASYSTRTRTELGVNADGLTYGADTDRGTPDLIAARATNGKSGYVYAEDLEGPTPKNPAEAAHWNETHGKPRSIPVYASDGHTRIGTFDMR